MTRLVLDAGALIAVDRDDPMVLAFLARSAVRRLPVVTSSPIVGQVWRNGQRQARLARLLKGVQVVAPDESAARRGGLLLAETSLADIVDALLADLCRPGDLLLTSDPSDLKVLLRAANTSVEIVSI